MKLSRIAAIVLCLVLLCSAAFAEFVPTPHPLDFEILVGKSQYSFPMSIAQAKEAGIIFDDEAGIYTNKTLLDGKAIKVPAGNGRSAFYAHIMLTPEAVVTKNYNENTLYVGGVDVESDSPQSIELPGGLILGKSTFDECMAAYGEPDYMSDEKDYASYDFNRDYTTIKLRFKDGILDNAEGFTHLGRFGLEFSPAAPDAEPADPTTIPYSSFILNGKLYNGKLTYRDLEADGWKIDSRLLERELEPAGSFIIMGLNTYLYNGEGLLNVFLYNPSENENCSVEDASVLYVGAGYADNVSFVLADGLTFGSTLDDVTASFGDNADIEEKEGYTFHTYSGLSNGAACSFSVADNEVFYLRVQP